MKLHNTVDVVWRERRNAWVVEGGNGLTAVLGIFSVHDARDDAIRVAREVAAEHDAEVRVLNDRGEEWPKHDVHGRTDPSGGEVE